MKFPNRFLTIAWWIIFWYTLYCLLIGGLSMLGVLDTSCSLNTIRCDSAERHFRLSIINFVSFPVLFSIIFLAPLVISGHALFTANMEALPLFLLTLVSAVLFVAYGFLLWRKKTIKVTKRLFWLFGIPIIILFLASCVTFPFIFRYPFAYEQETVRYINKNHAGLVAIFNTVLPESQQCHSQYNIQTSPSLLEDKSLLFRELIKDPQALAYYQCRKKVSDTLWQHLPDFDQLKMFSATAFMKLKDANTIQVMALNGSSFEIGRCSTDCGGQKNTEPLFQMLEGKRSFRPTYDEAWRDYAQDLHSYPLFNIGYFSDEGIHYLNYGEYEVVVPVVENGRVVGAVLRVYAD